VNVCRSGHAHMRACASGQGHDQNRTPSYQPVNRPCRVSFKSITCPQILSVWWRLDTGPGRCGRMSQTDHPFIYNFLKTFKFKESPKL
jgi:hypothetical protein